MTILNISKVILKKRKEKDITQEELASFLMVTKASVSKWETGQSNPDILLLPKIAAFFNISVDELLGYNAQLSETQIQKIINELKEEIKPENFETIVKKCKELVKQYYSCFSFIYSIGVFLFNHIDFIQKKNELEPHVDYLIRLFERVGKESNDYTLKNSAISMKGACLLQIGRPNEVLDLLPETDKLIPNEPLIITSYIQNGDFERGQDKLQVFMYKGLFELYNLMIMDINLNSIHWKETAKRTERLIEIFNISALNLGVTLNYYILVAKKYLGINNTAKAIGYLELALTKITALKENDFELCGDDYFNRIDAWIENNLVMGKNANRSTQTIKESFLNIVMNDQSFTEVLKEKRIKKLLKKLKEHR